MTRTIRAEKLPPENATDICRDCLLEVEILRSLRAEARENLSGEQRLENELQSHTLKRWLEAHAKAAGHSPVRETV